ncbi:Gfo/Idh/MocA family oxidoreductase [Sphingomonas sp. 2R-10]|uniref:Gfo/Idh/MocA family protein n=1 Tax=Sphingomonas sp. 2R-10 TaxID=3045148 RepID=UPI000F7A5140|nr:Gfo/Idh/MocA family oxidoreductase [Sphingomonas sp. 2R-10]MDJ0277464.1 Gfo/Idh/MocA family oxidoreductase [Sphingomonas sp. 2R-10]
MNLARRDVMLGAAALSLASSTRVLASEDRPLGYAIVGLGNYGLGRIIPEFANCRHSRLAAVVSGDPAKAAKVAADHKLPKRSIYAYRDFDRIRDNPEVDIVYVCLPNAMHAEFSIRAAQAGKHVLCEKPMAISVAECEAMIAASRKADRQLMIGYRCHFEPYNLEAMRLARSGAAGKIRYVRSEHGFVAGDPEAWRLKRALSGGGSLMDMGIYSLQAARYMTGEEPVAVTARESTDRRDPRFREVEDMIDWTLEFPSGALGSCQSMYSASQNHILLMGEKGRIELEPATGYSGQKLWVGSNGRDRAVTPPPGPAKTQFAGQLDHMAQCAANGRTAIVSGEEGLRDMRIIEAIYRSAREGRTIRLDGRA